MSQRVIKFWQKRSLRFWLTSGLCITVAPLLVFTLVSFTYINSQIIAPLITLSNEQSEIVQPINELQVAILDVSNSITKFTIDGQLSHQEEFTREAQQIDAAFAQLATIHNVGHQQLLSDLNQAKAQ
ncbi:hypothetical protein HG263_16730 [Pseudoalteromonas sp. JBTF-M23]|uniref:Uncharacterized protein n=1 Tax=Pseudoalteromonas caenipelagi TaxID=2726988 RepID=A0A849VFX4_9GAMM|nr:hypothetical protein [Pseudoalteromonas caenipelagi]NOU52176.1 hypothetical protein [Pseudoalteromonas caenipelagi]